MEFLVLLLWVLDFFFFLISDDLRCIYSKVIFRLLILISDRVHLSLDCLVSFLGFIFLMCFEMLDCTLTWSGSVCFLALYSCFCSFPLCSFVLSQLGNDFHLNSQGLQSRIHVLLFGQGHVSSHGDAVALRDVARESGGSWRWFLIALLCLTPWPK